MKHERILSVELAALEQHPESIKARRGGEHCNCEHTHSYVRRLHCGNDRQAHLGIDIFVAALEALVVTLAEFGGLGGRWRAAV